MAQQTIDIGSTPNDGTGDPLRTAFDKANDNFDELYALFGALGTAADLDIDTDGTLAANSDTKIASQKAVRTYVAAAIAALINSAPGALDTLDELAAALGDDANFASTVTTALAGKLALTGGTLSGDLHVPDDAYDATTWNGSDKVPTKNAVRDKIEAIVAGIPGTYTDEMARDAIGAAFAVAGILNLTVDDSGDTITLDSGKVTTQTGTSYTAVLADKNSYIRFTNGSAVSFTIPPNSSVAFPIGTIIEVEQGGAGALTFVAGSGVTLNSRSSDLTVAGQYATAFAKKVATDTWTVNGDL